eukprot:jgi/Chrzof1/12357/Cz06g31210.t1
MINSQQSRGASVSGSLSGVNSGKSGVRPQRLMSSGSVSLLGEMHKGGLVLHQKPKGALLATGGNAGKEGSGGMANVVGPQRLVQNHQQQMQQAVSSGKTGGNTGKGGLKMGSFLRAWNSTQCEQQQQQQQRQQQVEQEQQGDNGQSAGTTDAIQQQLPNSDTADMAVVMGANGASQPHCDRVLNATDQPAHAPGNTLDTAAAAETTSKEDAAAGQGYAAAACLNLATSSGAAAAATAQPTPSSSSGSQSKAATAAVDPKVFLKELRKTLSDGVFDEVKLLLQQYK